MSPLTSGATLASLTGLGSGYLLDRQQEVLEMVASAHGAHDILSSIARFSEAAMPGMLASVLVYDAATCSLRKGGYGALPPTFQEAIDGMTPGPVAGSCGTAAFRRQRVISADVATDPLWAPFASFAAQYGIVAAWSSPILDADGELLGVFGVYRGEVGEPTARDLKVVDHFTHLASLALQRRRIDIERERQAHLDPQTGLLNRGALQAFAATHGDVDDAACALAVFDLDHFKLHNDALGQMAGDRLIRGAGESLSASLPDALFFGRLASDQFVAVIAGNVTDGLREISTAVEELRMTPVRIDETHAVHITASAGLVTWRSGGHVVDLDQVLFDAVQAVASAKRLGRDRCVAFGPEDQARSDHRRRVTQELRHAITHGTSALECALQPIVCVQDGSVKAFEVLARLRDRSGVPISPADFIPIAEETGLIDPLGHRIFAEACALLAGPGLPAHVNLHVNLSIRQLIREGFVQSLVALTDEHGIGRGRLVLEVTESIWLDEDGPACAALLALRDYGFRLALDDFGAGYASLNLLQTLPFDHLKIDRALVWQTHTTKGRALCGAAVTMANALGILATAEGIETPEQMAVVRELGVDAGQGFLWARPMAVDAALQWFDEVGTSTAHSL